MEEVALNVDYEQDTPGHRGEREIVYVFGLAYIQAQPLRLVDPSPKKETNANLPSHGQRSATNRLLKTAVIDAGDLSDSYLFVNLGEMYGQ
jgi:hypothetical protein